MKYVASMKLDRDMSTAEINRLRVSLDGYMKEHPAIDDDSFRTMQSLALKLHNEKLIEKCAMANSRCLETDKLLRVRRSTLRKAEQHLALEDQPKTLNNNNKCCVVSPLQNGDSHSQQSLSQMMFRNGNNGNYGDPPSVVIRRRSYAGKAATPVYSPTADAYKECVKDMRLKEQLFRDSVITVDMLCNVVTSLPKNLSDSTLRGSRESLRGSCENLASAELNERKGMSLPSSAMRTVETSCGTTLTHSASDDSVRRRGGTREERRMNRRSARTFSMLSGSCESLPG